MILHPLLIAYDGIAEGVTEYLFLMSLFARKYDEKAFLTSSLIGWGGLLDRIGGLGLSGGGSSAADYPHVSGRRPERTKAFGLTGHFYADFTLPEKLELFNKKKVGVCLEGC